MDPWAQMTEIKLTGQRRASVELEKMTLLSQ